MHLGAVWSFSAAALALGLAGCSGDAPVYLGDGGADAGADAGDAPADETAVPPSGQPLPAGVAPPRPLLGARERLTGLGRSSCSHQVPPSDDGDRWCVFMRPPAGFGLTELWVVNVTQAAAGAPAACDGSSPLCRRLATNLWVDPLVVGGPVHPVSHEFHGDTLIFYADPISLPGQLHRGPVFAWRPGWSQPRRISSAQGIQCWGHRSAAVAHCLEGLAGDVSHPDSVELRAGAIADVPQNALTSIGRIRARKPNGDRAWLAGFSPAGDRFLVSSPDPDPLVESLRVIPVAELTGPAIAVLQPLLPEASQWRFSHDGGRLYFLREDGPAKRALHAADFPTGANATRLAGPIRDFQLLGDGPADAGIAALVEVDARTTALRLVRDPAGAAAAPTVFSATGTLEGVEISPDLRFTAWTDQGFNVRVVRHADLVTCDLNTSPRNDAFQPTFTVGAGFVFWKESVAGGSDRLDGYRADPDGCQGKQRFAQALDFLLPVGDKALVFGDELDASGSTVTLKYASLEGKTWPAQGAVRIHPQVDNASLVLVDASPRLLLFRVAAGGAAGEGTYLFAPPF